jgi:phosphatidylethanolamine-binding protein (PEBP) family uncharacterized protein
MPPKGHGVHHYHFRLIASDHLLPDRAGLTKAEVLHAVEGHSLAEARYTGTYERHA